MATLYVFILLTAVTTTFAHTFLDATQRLNNLQPTVTSVLSSITPDTEAISAFSQLKQTQINSSFRRFFKYSDDSNNGKNDASYSELKRTDLNSSLQTPFKQTSHSDGSNNGKNDDSYSELKRTDLNSSLQKPFKQTSNSDGTNNGPNNSSLDSQLDLNSPILSEFAEYNLQVQKYANIYPLLYDFSFSPDALKESFYNEAIYFALENGLYKVGSLPQQLADAAAHAFPSLTPLEFFKVISNTLELSLQRGGIATEKNYQALCRLNAKDLEDAMKVLKVHDAQSALHAICVGSGTFFKSLNLDYPDQIKYILSTLVDQLYKVPTGGVQ